MILSFRHKGLESFFLTGKTKGIQGIHAKRLRELLTALNVTTGPQDLSSPSWRCTHWSETSQAFTLSPFKPTGG
jgi:proteic killer suppression protein